MVRLLFPLILALSAPAFPQERPDSAPVQLAQAGRISGAAAASPTPLESEQEAADGVPWAKPLHGGTMSIVAIVPDACRLDVAALETTLDAKISLMTTWTAQLPDPPEAPAKGFIPFAQRLSKRLAEKCDVIIIGRVDLEAWPSELQHLVYNAVYAGAGLVLTHVPVTSGSELEKFQSTFDPADVEEALRRGLPPLQDSDLHDILPGQLDQVRMVHLQYAGDLPKTHALIPMPPGPPEISPLFKDNAFALLCRAILWAGNREPVSKISGISDASPQGPAEDEIPPDLPPAFVEAIKQSVAAQLVRPFRIVFAEPLPEAMEVRAQLRRTNGPVPFVETTVQAPKGAQEATIHLLIGPGPYVVDAWLSSRRGVVDWFSQEVTMQGWPTFRQLEYDKNFLLPNDSLVLSMNIPGVFSHHREGSVYARAVDSLGRLVAESTLGFNYEGGDVSLRLNFADLIAPMVKVEVFAVEGPPHILAAWEQNVADRAHLYFPVRAIDQAVEPRLLVSNPAPGEHNTTVLLQLLHEAGATAVYAPGQESSLIESAYSGLRLLPELANFSSSDEENFHRSPCLSNADYLHAQSIALKKNALLTWAGSTGSYSLGNPSYLFDREAAICQSESCLSNFHKLLELDYGSIKSLNTAWNSSYNDWSHVTPLSRAAALESSNPPPAIDFWEYMDGIYSAFHGQAADAIRAADQSASVGFRALRDAQPWHGYDWPELSRQIDMIALDPELLAMEKVRSYFRQSPYSGIALGDTSTLSSAGFASWTPWHAVTHRLPALWWMAPFPTTAGGTSTAVTAEGNLESNFQAMLDSLTHVDEGIGSLLLASERASGPIGILESRASRRLNELAPLYGCGSFDSEWAFCRIVEGMGYQYRFIDEQSLNKEGLAGIEVLILPLLRSLSAEQVEGIREFVGRGGALIADTLPATHDRHGVKHDRPLLNDVLGLEASAHEPEPQAVPETPVMLPAQPVAASSETQALGPILHETDTTLTLLLNRALTPGVATDAEIVGEIRNLLEKMGVMPPFNFQTQKQQPLHGEVIPFRFDSGFLLAVLASPDAPVKSQHVQFGVDKSAHVYDLREALPILRPQKFGVDLAPGECAVFSVLPYEPASLELTVPEEIVQGQRLLFSGRILDADGNAITSDHLIRVDLLMNFETPLRHYRRTLRTDDGIFQGYMPLALNEISGSYTVRAKDLLTGITTTATVKVLNLPR